MQLELDLGQCHRCAQRTDDALKEMNVPLLERALLRLLWEHPNRVAIDEEKKIVRLCISYRDAGRWIRRNVAECRGLGASPAGLFKAVCAWRDRGVLHTTDSRPMTFTAHFGHLAEWHALEESRRSPTFADVRSCSPTFADVRSCSPTFADVRVNERKKEQLDHSFIHSDPSALSAQVEALPPLPLAVWQPDTRDAALRQALLVWWNEHGLRERGCDPLDVLGAVLAARKRDPLPNDLDAYVAGCLRRGVGDCWRRQAEAFLRSGEAKPYAPMGTPQ